MKNYERKLLKNNNAKLEFEYNYANCYNFEKLDKYNSQKYHVHELLRDDVARHFNLSKDDIHSGGLGKSGGIRMFIKEFGHSKQMVCCLKFDDDMLKDWFHNDKSLLKMQMEENKDFKKWLNRMDKHLDKDKIEDIEME